MDAKELISELEKMEAVTRVSADGMSFQELCDTCNKCRDSMRRLLKLAKDQGSLKVGRAYRETLSGTQQSVPVYSIVLSKPAKSKSNLKKLLK